MNSQTSKTSIVIPVEPAAEQAIESRMRIEIRDIGIPPRPTILQQIDAETERDEPDFIRLAKIINSDVALAAGLIKTANSPFFAFSKKARTAQEALLILGLKLAVNTIASLALQQLFKHSPSMERFWDASATTARVAGWLARQLKGRAGIRPEDAYTFALFRDCGVPILMIPFPEYRAVLAEANAERTAAFTDIENQQLGINHAKLGADLAENWMLPDDLCAAIRYHHDLDVIRAHDGKLSECSRTLIAFAQLAEYLIQLQTGRMQSHEWEKLGPTALNILDFDPSELEVLAAEAQEVISDA